MEDKKINVLGTEYKIVSDKRIEVADQFGNCNTGTKIIDICASVYEEWSTKAYSNRITRHEILHAFAQESGVPITIVNEELVIDWIATMYPKMKKIFKKLGIEE
jgi:hypothetical protein